MPESIETRLALAREAKGENIPLFAATIGVERFFLIKFVVRARNFLFEHSILSSGNENA